MDRVHAMARVRSMMEKGMLCKADQMELKGLALELLIDGEGRRRNMPDMPVPTRLICPRCKGEGHIAVPPGWGVTAIKDAPKCTCYDCNGTGYFVIHDHKVACGNCMGSGKTNCKE